MGKCKGAPVVGVRTRARAALAMAAGANTNSSSGNSSLPEKKIRKSSASNQLRKRRRATPENFVSSASCRPETTTTTSLLSEGVETTAYCSTTGEIFSDFPASCCPSNNNAIEIIADPERVGSPETSPRCFDYCRTARRERKSESDDQDSPPRRPDAKSTAQIKMPLDSEIEEFFSAAEKDLHKRFSDKYNFDIVKDVPLEGRYEWVPIKP